jgi:tRNA uridine 5-carboxymethylaminomethyl modification enzyme
MAEGVGFGLVPERVFHVEQRRWEARRKARAALTERRLTPTVETRREVRRLVGVDLRGSITWAKVLCRPDVDRERLARVLPELAGLEEEDRRIVVKLLRYEGYLDRHCREVDRLRRLAHLAIPQDLDVSDIPGLSREVVEQLESCRPRTIAEAEHLPGLTPAALAILVARVADRQRAPGGGSP